MAYFTDEITMVTTIGLGGHYDKNGIGNSFLLLFGTIHWDVWKRCLILLYERTAMVSFDVIIDITLNFD